MDIEGADDPELTALRTRYKASIQSSDMTREELIDTLAWNLAMYELLDGIKKENAALTRNIIKHRTNLVESLERHSDILQRHCDILQRRCDILQRLLENGMDVIIHRVVPEIMRQSMDRGARALASKAGKKGAASKHAGTRALKKWALGEASKTRGSMKAIAKQLVLRLPAELAQASTDPERFIYDTLRLQAHPAKPKKAKGRGFHPNTASRQP